MSGPENKPSFLFDGPVNTIAQGHPVPVGYGEMYVGSAVISAGIVTEEIVT
jgi:predicted phage tail protein